MYTISEIANLCDVSAYTLRFYDKEGLLPFVTRNSQGNRQFCEDDLKMIRLICCLKNTGMQIKEIRKYIDLYMQGGHTSPVRKQMMIDHSKQVTEKIEALKEQMKVIEEKIEFYNSYDASQPCCHE